MRRHVTERLDTLFFEKVRSYAVGQPIGYNLDYEPTQMH